MPADKLEKLRNAVRRKRDLDHTISDMEQRLAAHKQARMELEHKTLPDMFMAARVTALAVEPEGNMPAYRAELKDYYKAVISANWPDEKQQKAFALLEQLKLGDLIKTIVEVQFNRGERAAATKFLTAINKLVRADQIHERQGVPWTTLTAAIKEHYENGGQLGDNELATLGATVGFIVTLKEE
jgi:hypothetical protein